MEWIKGKEAHVHLFLYSDTYLQTIDTTLDSELCAGVQMITKTGHGPPFNGAHSLVGGGQTFIELAH